MPKTLDSESTDEKRKPIQPIIYIEKNKNQNTLMIINGYCFYKNKDTNGVLFPLHKINEQEESGEIVPIKLTKTDVLINCVDYFVQKYRKKDGERNLDLLSNLELLSRFGNVEAMLISLAFSEQAWKKNPVLMRLFEIIQITPLFTDYLKQLRQSHLVIKTAKTYKYSSGPASNPSKTHEERYLEKLKNQALHQRFLKTLNKKLSQRGKIYDATNFPTSDSNARLENYNLSTVEKKPENPALKDSKWISPSSSLKGPEPTSLSSAPSMQKRLENQTLQIKSFENKQNRFFPGLKQTFSNINAVEFILKIFKQIAIACIGNLVPFSFFDHSSHLKDEKNRSLKIK